VYLVCSPKDLFAAVGIQKGATKVFLRQHAFDTLEKIRSKILTTNAVKIQCLSRKYVYRSRFERTIRRIVMGQASARRFLARKHLAVVRQRKAATKIQSTARGYVYKRKYQEKRDAAVALQAIGRAAVARKEYAKLATKSSEKRRLNDAATKIQCLFRIIVAKKVFEQVKSIERRDSTKAPKLEGKALKAAIKADRAAAVARQNAKDRAKEVDKLTTKLAGEKSAVEDARHALEDLSSIKQELEAAMAELKKVQREAAASAKRVEALEKENAELKMKLESGDFVTDSGYTSKIYADYEDLEALDKRMYVMRARSKKNKSDLKDLISALSILK